jgi:hypothetical protein
MPNLFITALNAGELSPYLDARADVEKYKSGCRTLENMVVLPYGGVYRRFGTEYLGEAKNASQRCRLIGFNYSTTTRFVLEFGNQYIRVWGNDTIVSHATGTAWAAGTVYAAGDLVTNGGITYLARENHTASALFATDSSKWYAQSGGILEVPTPYLEADLRELQYAQINDVMYLAHANHAPRKLTRLADNKWALVKVDWKYPPLLDQNITDATIESIASYGTTTMTGRDANMNAKNNTFLSGHVGSHWAIQWPRKSGSVNVDISNSQLVSDVLDIQGTWTVTTVGTWKAKLRLLRITNKKMDDSGPAHTAAMTRTTTTATVTQSNHGFATGDQIIVKNGGAPFDTSTPKSITKINDNSYSYSVVNSGATGAINVSVYNITNAEVVREFTSLDTARNFTANGQEDERVGLLLQVTDFVSATSASAFLESTDFNSGGTFVINSIANSGQNANVTVKKWFGSEIKETTQWSEAAFSDVRGYPRAVCVHEQRLCFGGTSHQPNTIWCSKTDDFEDFQLGASADDALSLSVASSEGNRIAWMFSQKRLMVGTTGDEWTIGGADLGAAFSSTNLQANKQSSFGSKTMRAILLNDVLLFVQRRGRKVRELTYDFGSDGWVAPDLTVLAEHITSGEIVELAFQQQPDAILWCVRGDGELCGMSYEREQKVVAWHRHSTDGDFESVATVYGLSGNDDEVWFSVKRTINGVTKRYIERFKADARDVFESQTKADYWYLDCAKRYSGASTSTITGLSHLNGKTVGVLSAGNVHADRTVSSGSITLSASTTKALVGLPYTSTALPMKFEYQLEDGPTRGRAKRINRVEVGLYKSLGGEVSTNATEWLAIKPTDFTDASPLPSSDDVEVVVGGDYTDSADIYTRQRLPYPLTIRHLVVKLDAYGD